MPSVTTFVRLEGRTRRADLRPGLAAAVHDPLWLLARQKQLAAFEGEDAATPIGVDLEATTAPITRYRLGSMATTASTHAYDGTVPLEAVAEAEAPAATRGANLRVAVQAGLRFRDFLHEQQADALWPEYRDTYPVDAPAPGADSETARFLALVAGRVPDGFRLRDAFRPPGSAPGTVVVPAHPDASQYPGVHDAARAWLEWFDRLIDVPHATETAWQRERLEYGLAVAAPAAEGETVLSADQFTGGRLEWYSFDETAGSLGAAADPTPPSIAARMLPAPVSFGGMPASRWFEFEDGAVNFGKIDAGPPDVARMVLVEFACLYGNDHFLVPLELPVGSLCRISSLIVSDNFGGRTAIRPSEAVATRDGAWSMFRLTADRGASDFLFLAPTLGSSLDAAPIEEVLFVRDEMADMAWAVERIVESPTGRPLDRYQAHQEERRRVAGAPAPGGPQTAAPLTYTLQTAVPPFWIPLLPVSVGPREIKLQLREMLDDVGNRIPPQGRLLAGTPALELFEEEVPRAGARVRRGYRYARWTDGSTHVWVGRETSPGRGEGSSGLRFDAVEPTGRA